MCRCYEGPAELSSVRLLTRALLEVHPEEHVGDRHGIVKRHHTRLQQHADILHAVDFDAGRGPEGEADIVVRGPKRGGVDVPEQLFQVVANVDLRPVG